MDRKDRGHQVVLKVYDAFDLDEDDFAHFMNEVRCMQLVRLNSRHPSRPSERSTAALASPGFCSRYAGERQSPCYQAVRRVQDGQGDAFSRRCMTWLRDPDPGPFAELGTSDGPLRGR